MTSSEDLRSRSIGSGVDRIARGVAEVFAPAVLVAVVSFAVGITGGVDPWSGAAWSMISAIFCSFVPLWFMVKGAAAGRWDTHHVRDRADRLLPLSVAVTSVIAGLAMLYFGGAPRQLIALVLAMLCCLVLALAVTQVWKISLHSAITAGTAAILVVTFGPWFWSGLAAIALVSWSRWVTGDHTPAQVVLGSVLGFALGGGLYAAFL